LASGLESAEPLFPAENTNIPISADLSRVYCPQSALKSNSGHPLVFDFCAQRQVGVHALPLAKQVGVHRFPRIANADIWGGEFRTPIRFWSSHGQILMGVHIIKYYGSRRHHEALGKVTPNDVCLGKWDSIQTERRRLQAKTLTRRQAINAKLVLSISAQRVPGFLTYRSRFF
jgi:hypothetical protein